MPNLDTCGGKIYMATSVFAAKQDLNTVRLESASKKAARVL